MAHFAELDDNNIVLRVTVVSNDDLLDDNGVEQEALGIAVCQSAVGPGRWVQTSYTGKMRGKYAAIGDRYDEQLDKFIGVQPYSSWTLDETGDWQPPTPIPTDGALYLWDEATLAWVLTQPIEV